MVACIQARRRAANFKCYSLNTANLIDPKSDVVALFFGLSFLGMFLFSLQSESLSDRAE